MSALMLAICWLPPLVHGWWLLGGAIVRRVDDLARAMVVIDTVFDPRHGPSQRRYAPREEWFWP